MGKGLIALVVGGAGCGIAYYFNIGGFKDWVDRQKETILIKRWGAAYENRGEILKELAAIEGVYDSSYSGASRM